MVVAVTTFVGVAFVSTRLVIPGASRIPGVPEFGFSRRQREFVVRGAVLSAVGPFVGILVSLLFSPLSGNSVLSPLVTFPVMLGWTLVLVGLVGNFSRELYLSRLIPPTVSESLVSTPVGLGRTRASMVRTPLIGGAPVVVSGMATVFLV